MYVDLDKLQYQNNSSEKSIPVWLSRNDGVEEYERECVRENVSVLGWMSIAVQFLLPTNFFSFAIDAISFCKTQFCSHLSFMLSEAYHIYVCSTGNIYVTQREENVFDVCSQTRMAIWFSFFFFFWWGTAAVSRGLIYVEFKIMSVLCIYSYMCLLAGPILFELRLEEWARKMWTKSDFASFQTKCPGQWIQFRWMCLEISTIVNMCMWDGLWQIEIMFSIEQRENGERNRSIAQRW